MIDLIRAHLASDIELTGVRTELGHWSLTAERGGKRVRSVIGVVGGPVDCRQAAVNLAYWL